MFRKYTGVLAAVVMVSAMCVGTAGAAAKRVREPKMSTEQMIRKAVEEAIKDSVPAAGGKFEFTAKRMRPPKNDKWKKRWNEMGQDGWQMVGNNENIYIFQRPGVVDMSADPKAQKQAQRDADKAAKKAQKDADKASKEAAKQAAKDAKAAAKAEKAAQ
ncbi:MAG: hypothetical protein COV45_04805 [Deltaproteobacteria bacterium CG11_big_fil_rev_8_21_14_0_20_47_16]|nr:MAG: hypothetical protein COV45_04805 [Deltaproteobacteria bacterium CG11_big_fil_rev_8_21_14_0_20_47_16]